MEPRHGGWMLKRSKSVGRCLGACCKEHRRDYSRSNHRGSEDETPWRESRPRSPRLMEIVGCVRQLPTDLFQVRGQISVGAHFGLLCSRKPSALSARETRIRAFISL